MPDPKPKGVPPEALGIKTDSPISIRRNINAPAVLRDSRGRVVWSIRGNSEEDNEKLGIRNIQELFLQRFPEFNDLFSRVEQNLVAVDNRINASEYIVERVGTAKKFNELFGNSARSKNITPYFKGSHQVALSKSFGVWGIEFKFKKEDDLFIYDRRGGGIKWTLPGNTPETNLALGIRNIQNIFLLAYPEFTKLFPLGTNGLVQEDKRNEAREYVLAKVGTLNKFNEIFGGTPRNLDSAPYFETSIRVAIEKSFGVWGIEFNFKKDNPAFLYDKRGKISWKLQSNTQIDNERLAIRNMQNLFLQSFPEFDLQFPLDSSGLIPEDMLNEARDFILEKVGKIDKFKEVFSNTPIARRQVPCFEGSHVKALTKTFAVWGIDIIPTNSLNPYDLNGKIRWHISEKTQEENEQMGIRNVQELFLKAFPEFDELFPRDEDGLIAEGKREEAAEYIVNKVGLSNKIFGELISSSVLLPSVAAYFEGSRHIILQKSFAPWGIEFEVRETPNGKVLIPPNYEQLQINKLQERLQQTRDELFAFYRQFGDIHQHTLLEHNRTDLVYAISKYPGGRFQVEVELGFSEKVPLVTYDGQGRVRWSLPDNTSEENEQMGIRNVQELFLKAFPEFDELFPRDEDGLIAEGKREEAKNFILKKIGGQSKFSSTIANSAIHYKTTPYFEGKVQTAIEKSFSVWGIEFHFQQEEPLITYTRNGRIIWNSNYNTSEENEQIGIKNVQGLFLKSFPDFDILFSRGEDGLIEEDKREEARIFILEKLGSKDKFLEIIGNSARNIHITPYFEGSYLTAIAKSFGVWGIQFSFQEENQLISYNKKADISWNLRNNIPEQNEQMGISNVQGLFLQHFPEFSELFPRGEDGLIADDKREEARNYILEKIGSRDKFVFYISGTAITNGAPYFEGSYQIVLAKAFGKWGIQFSFQKIDPLITYDRIGRISWQRKENTREQNELIGIKNIQGLFLKAFPEFNDLFPRDEQGMVIPEKREEAEQFIVRKIGNADDFNTKIIPLGNYSTPYFEGSHLTALIKSFAAWGIRFEFDKNDSLITYDKKGRVAWNRKKNTPEQNEQIGIRNVQGIFLKAYPEFNEHFPRDEHGMIIPEKQEEAKKFILEKIADAYYFIKIFGSSCRQKGVTPYFEGSHLTAITKSFSPLGIDLDFKIDDPLVTYNRRKKVCWYLSENSPEQNEKMGIRNVQGLFLKKFPEFNNRFPRTNNGKIAEEIRENAKQFILEKIGGIEKFKNVIGGSILHPNAIPYFKGNYQYAIEKAFSEWGLEFSFQKEDPLITYDNRGRILWKKRKNTSEQNLQLGISNVQGLFLQSFPEFNQQFPRNEQGLIDAEKRAEAIKFILEKIGKVDKLKETTGASPTYRNQVPYFGGSYQTIIQKSFSSWGLEFSFQKEDPLITYNIAGNICWQLPENTQEQNEELGIRNVHGLFLQAFPEFNDLFPRDEENLIANDKREEAKKFILEKIGAQSNFLALITRSVGDIPYFDKSHLIAIEKSFSKWGIDFYNESSERMRKTKKENNISPEEAEEWLTRLMQEEE